MHRASFERTGARILDILLMDMAGCLDERKTAAAAVLIFDERATRKFPPAFVMPLEWRPEVEWLAGELGFPQTNSPEIEAMFQRLLGRLATQVN